MAAGEKTPALGFVLPPPPTKKPNRGGPGREGVKKIHTSPIAGDSAGAAERGVVSSFWRKSPRNPFPFGALPATAPHPRPGVSLNGGGGRLTSIQRGPFEIFVGGPLPKTSAPPPPFPCRQRQKGAGGGPAAIGPHSPVDTSPLGKIGVGNRIPPRLGPGVIKGVLPRPRGPPSPGSPF